MSPRENESAIYEFRVEGRLDSSWSDWFAGLEIRHTVDEETSLPVTVLSGPVLDQSELQGILQQISSLNLKLLSMNQTRQKID